MSGRPDGGAASARPATRRRDDEDAATVIAILTAIAAASNEPAPDPAARSVWGDPAHRLGLDPASPVGWWASGLAR
ncbi:acyl-CoA carboxylase epsilon subunit [Nakamurella sp.]|uniref:acyl-CoA carboxylase epsilon subunit n=1 Tax=Nakamurella sp. TaxID=1869182 RepID=UPI00378351D0